MLYKYDEYIKKNNLMIKDSSDSDSIYKIEKGVYSDKQYVPESLVIAFKYPNAVFTLDNAIYHYDLTDTVPDKYYLMTDKDSSKIADSRVIQLFDNNNQLKLGAERVAVDDGTLLMYNKERLLVEVIRYRFRLSEEYYKEVINNYRSIIHKLNIQLLEEYIEKLPKSSLVKETIKKEVL